MAEPSPESVIEAMRSDLGVGRVDDLELENGRKGRTVRPGQASNLVTVSKTAPKAAKNSLASRWKAAIDSGKFDDDDAEAVKGLDKIGGGRLHAQGHQENPKSSSSMAPIRPFKLPPAFVPKSQGESFSIATSHLPVAQAIPMPLELIPPTYSQVRQAIELQKTFWQDSVQQVAQQTPDKQTVNKPVGQQQPACYPDPATVHHEADIFVTDRKTQGPGKAFLVATSPTDTGIFSIFLRGYNYLEYPVMAMVNYMASSNDLCPQFYEADGESITTTCLTFTSQDQIATFMNAVRILKARHAVAVAPQTEKTVVSSPIFGPGLGIKKTGSTRSRKKAQKPGLSSARGKEKTKIDALSVGTGPKVSAVTPAAKIEPASALIDADNDVDEEANLASERALGTAKENLSLIDSLVDLSLSPPSSLQQPFFKKPGLSSYAADLYLLTDSSLSSSNVGSESALTEKAETSTAAVFSTKGRKEGTRIMQTTAKLVPKPGAEVEARNMDIVVCLKKQLASILPMLSAMAKTLSLVDSASLGSLVKEVLRETEQDMGGNLDGDGMQIKLAKKVLLATLSAVGEMNQLLNEESRESKHYRYSQETLFSLRNSAALPPGALDQLAFLPRPGDKSKSSKGGPSVHLSKVPGEPSQKSTPSPTELPQEQQSSATDKKGLRNSKWATGDGEILKENAYHFTGVGTS